VEETTEGQAMTGGRAIILGRIREALRNNPAPRPHTSHSQSEAAADHNGHAQREWLPKVGETLTERIDLFAKISEGLTTEFHRVPTMTAARDLVTKLAAESGWKKVGSHSHHDVDALLEGIELPIVRTEKGYAIDDLESCDAGITGCDVLVAQTGGIMVSVESAGGRALSVLPPHHVVIARTSQMVPDLTAAFEHVKQKYGKQFPSFLSFITGPSRTGDIERILVLGAHGPKRLTVILLD
jgi:L-lactate dehydrogenase complex protein LldG